MRHSSDKVHAFVRRSASRVHRTCRVHTPRACPHARRRAPTRADPGCLAISIRRTMTAKRPGAPRSAPPVRAALLRDQNEYVAETRGNGSAPRPLFHTALTGLFQKPLVSVASSMSEPSFVPAPMLYENA